jgi:hypothetical protein
VTALRKELSDWRTKLDGQVKNYRDVSLPRLAWGRPQHAALPGGRMRLPRPPCSAPLAALPSHTLPPAHRQPTSDPPQDIGDLNKTINSEVSALKEEFAELKGVIKQQIDKTASLAMAQVRALPG